MSYETDPQVLGPNCTSAQAEELFGLLLANWQNQKFRNLELTMALYCEELQRKPYRIARRAIRRVIRNEEFFPPVATILKTIEACWPAVRLDRPTEEKRHG